MKFLARFVLFSVARLVPAFSEDVSLVLLQTRAEKLVAAPNVQLPQIEADPGVADSLMGSMSDDAAAPLNTAATVAHTFTPHHGRYESRDANGNWWPVAITSMNIDGTYDAILDFDGTLWSHVLLGNIRRTTGYKAELELEASAATVSQPAADAKRVLPEQTVFVLGLEGDNACPVGYRGIGDERSCKLARDALGLDHWGKKSSLYDHPGGCFRDPTGDVFLNNHTGRAAEGHTPICEEEFEFGVDGKFESRDADGKWWSVTVSEKDLDNTYTAILDDGTLWAGVAPYNIRKKVGQLQLMLANTSSEADVTADFVAGANGTNACPFGYKGIGDERTCHRALLALAFGKFGRKDSWGGQPAGCFFSAAGEVNLNNHTGWGHKDSKPICEKEPELGLIDAYETRASDGTFKPVTVDSKDHDGSYSVSFADGVRWSGVWQYNLRRSDPTSPEEVSNSSTEEAHQAAYEAMDANGRWWPVSVTGQAADGTFIVTLDFDGTVWQNVHPENMRAIELPASAGNTSAPEGDINAVVLNDTLNASEGSLQQSLVQAEFVAGTPGSNACPSGYKGIGDESTCKQAMRALAVGPWGNKLWSKNQPAGCFKAPSGDVQLNNHTGVAVKGHAPLCEKDFEVGLEGAFEARDQNGKYFPVTVADTDGNGTYTVMMEDGTRQPGVWEYNIRRKMIPDFVLNPTANESCPLGYRRVGDERTCNQAMLYLGVGVDYSAGFMKNPAGDVFCWYRTNDKDSKSGKRLKSAICEKELDTGIKGKFEAMDVEGKWWPVTVASKEGEDYAVTLEDGTTLSGVFGHKVRRINTTANAVVVVGMNGSNECPLGYASIVEESACKQAMGALGLGPWGRVDAWPDHPAGCFRNPNGDVYLNSDNGSGKADRMPICGKADAAYTRTLVVENSTEVIPMDVPEAVELPSFVLGSPGTNSCPGGYKGIGDERTCKKAMHSLGYGPYGKKASWDDSPRGCVRSSKGVVNLNNNSGSAKESHSPICERDFEIGVEGQFETLDSSRKWWPVMISGRNPNGSYSVYLADGSKISEIDQFNIRRRAKPEANETTSVLVAAAPGEKRSNFALAQPGSNACPLGYKPVHDEKMCKHGMRKLGLGPWGRADAWSDHPGGCFRNPDGDVYLNSEMGQGKVDRSAICISQVTTKGH